MSNFNNNNKTMIFRFLLISDEVAGFKREIQINADDTFYNLHRTIIESIGYEEKEFASFFMCTDDWRFKDEITLVEKETYSDRDSFTMKDTRLEEFFEDEGERMMYVFDPASERGFFMELREIILGKEVDEAICTQQAGKAPIQIMEKEEELVEVKPVVLPDPDEDLEDEEDDLEEDDSVFYGDDDSFDEDELDEDGFDNLDEDGELEMPSEEEF